MEFKAKRRTLTVNIDGDAHIVRFPLLGELREYREKLVGNDGEKLLTEFLVGLGLSAEAQESLELSDLNEIVGLLTDQKKT